MANVDVELRRLIADATGSPEYWSFAAARNGYSHCYFRYPAMMVAEMQEHLISMVRQLQPNLRKLADPFAGSGTVMLEAMFQGLEPHAFDINPLAILLCKSKKVLCPPGELRAAVDRVHRIASFDRRRKIEAKFSGLEKWFTPAAQRQLSALRRAIREIADLHVRRFLWVVLAETVRRTSRSRTSTYKLHIRPGSERRRLPKPLPTFLEVAGQNIDFQRRTRRKLRRTGLLKVRTYKRKTRIAFHDARRFFSTKFDLIVTSPPYGDNQTTVPYGQSSYLPLQWIDLGDIASGLSPSCLRTAYEIDHRSLGGRLPIGLRRRTADEVIACSPSLLRLLRRIPKAPPDRHLRIITFAQDVDASLKTIAAAAQRNAYLIFTLGNRRVANRVVPLTAIVAELFKLHGVEPVISISRKIPSKRMPSRNDTVGTIRKEQILIFRKVSS